MSLSFFTLLILTFLAPSTMFFIGIRKGGLVKASDLFDTKSQEIGIQIIVSFFISALLLFLISYINPDFLNQLIECIRYVAKDVGKIRSEQIWMFSFFILLYFGCTLTLGYFFGVVYPHLHFWNEKNTGGHTSQGLKGFLYHSKDFDGIWASVVTKTTHGDKRLMYLGLVHSVKMNGEDLESITLSIPLKTYIDFSDYLKTKHNKTPPTGFFQGNSEATIRKLPRNMSPVNCQNIEDNMFFISKENIENVFFQRFSLPVDPCVHKVKILKKLLVAAIFSIYLLALYIYFT